MNYYSVKQNFNFAKSNKDWSSYLDCEAQMSKVLQTSQFDIHFQFKLNQLISFTKFFCLCSKLKNKNRRMNFHVDANESKTPSAVKRFETHMYVTSILAEILDQHIRSRMDASWSKLIQYNQN